MKLTEKLVLLAFGFLMGALIAAPRAQMKRDLSPSAFEPKATLSLLAAGGQCEYGRSSEGMWHQQAEGRETTRDYKPRCGKLGVSYRPVDVPWGLTFSYFDAGQAHLSSVAIAYPDDDARKHNAAADTLRTQCRQEPAPDCAQRIRGTGGIRGLELSASYDFLKIWKLTAEAGIGVAAYRASWNVRVLPLDPDCLGDDNKCKWQAQINQRTGWLLSPTAHLKAKFAPFFAEVHWQFRTTQHAPGSMGYDKTLRGLFVGMEIPVWSL